MTLLGKIFTVLIFIMSCVFLAFSIMVYATHTNWRELAQAKEQELSQKQAKIRQLEDLQTELSKAIDMEKAARRIALAALETKLRARTTELERVQQELAKLTATEGTTAGALVTAQNELATMTSEVKQLRDNIRTAQQDVDDKYQQVVTLTDEINQLRMIRQELTDRQEPLVTQVAAMKKVMDKLGVRMDVAPDGSIRTDADGQEPRVDGIVVNIGEKDLLEISVGSDDGIQVGHKLDVFRDNEYLARVRVVKTSPDRAVVEIIPEFRKGLIRKGDRVATEII
jgi:cell division protein FtsL